jgi:hypothetical protein
MHLTQHYGLAHFATGAAKYDEGERTRNGTKSKGTIKRKAEGGECMATDMHHCCEL